MATRFEIDVSKALVDLKELNSRVKRLGASLDGVEGGAAQAFKGMEFQANQALSVMKFLDKSSGKAGDAFREMAALVSRSSEALKTSTKVLNANFDAIQKLTRQEAQLSAALKLTGTEQFKNVQVDKERLKGEEQRASAEERSLNASKANLQEIKQLNTEKGRDQRLTEADVKARRKEVDLLHKYANALRLAKVEAKLLREGNAKRAIEQEEINKATGQALRAQQKVVSQYRVLQAERKALSSPAGRRSVEMAEENKALRDSIALETRRTAALQKAREEQQYLTTSEAKESLELQEHNKATREAITSESRRTATLEKLRSELEYVRSAEGKEVNMLKAEIAEQRRLAAAQANTTITRRRSSKISNQFTASMRAGLMGLRTSIGIYTSSTVIAASAVFGLTRALRTGLEAGSQYTAAIQRTAAITGATSGQMRALEEHVRSLGATTQFTTTEVAKASSELALIGLTAGQTSQALEPVLNLAIIGNTTISDSAVRATDAMLVFGKTVEDLPGIVDDLATAATNSSASVDQLTNALTYAGPPAEALGLSMKDTLAAVEALSNAGIRGSRAGTSLRRAFTKLADPTKEGAKALQEMGVAVFDFQGKSLPLLSILEQMREGLKGLSKQEQVSSIERIFGVRASSSILALLKNTDSFGRLRAQLELTNGAAAEMSSTLRDSLHFDYKDLTSAFEALQINVFKDNEFSIRKWTEELRQFFQYMGDTAENGKTHLENYSHSIKLIGEALLSVFAVSKLNSFTARVVDLTNSTIGMYRSLRTGLSVGRQAVRVNGLRATSGAILTAGIKKQTAAIQARIAARETESVAAGAEAAGGAAASVAGGAVAAIGGVVSGFAALVGVGYAIWSIYRIFKDAAPGAKKSVEQSRAEAEAEYRNLKKKAEEVANNRKISSLKASKESAQASIKEQTSIIEQLNAAAKRAASDDQLNSDQRAQRLKNINILVGVHRDKISDLRSQLKGYRKDLDAAAQSGTTYQKAVLERERLSEELDKLTHKKNQTSEDRNRIQTILLQIRKLRDTMKTLEIQGKDTKVSINDFLQSMDTTLPKRLNQVFLESGLIHDKDSMSLRTAANSLNKYEGEVAAAKDRLKELSKEESRGIDVSKKKQEIMKVILHSSVLLTKSLADYLGVLKKYNDAEKDWVDSKSQLDYERMSDPQKLATDIKKRDKLRKQLEGFKGGSEVSPAKLEEMASKARDLASLESSIKSRQETGSHQVVKTADSYQQLLDKFAPITAAQREYAKGVKEVTEAQSKHKISTEQVAQATALLSFQLVKAKNEYSGRTIDERVAAIRKWEAEELKDVKTAQDRARVHQIAQKAIDDETQGIRRQEEALRSFNQALDDQVRSHQRQIDLNVMAVGMGQQQYQRRSSLIGLSQEEADKELKLQRDHQKRMETARRNHDQDEMDRENATYQTQLASLRAHYQLMEEATRSGYERIDAAESNQLNGVRGGLEDVMVQGSKQADMMRSQVTSAFDSMSDAVANFATSGKLDFGSFVKSVIQGIAKMELRIIESKIAGMLLSYFSGGYPSTQSSSVGYDPSGGSMNYVSHINFAKGGVFTSPSFSALSNTVGDTPTIVPMAKGAALIREAGPEAVMPLSRGPGGKLGVSSYSGSGSTVNFTQNISVNGKQSSGGSQAGESQQADAIRQFNKRMKDVAMKTIQDEQRPGGSLWRMQHS